MKVVVQEVENEGLAAFLGKPVTLFCGVYIYTGTLVGINATCVKLDAARLVFETGAFGDKHWKDAQALPTNTWYVTLQAIESFGYIRD
jgi:hypothetical protein